jgi:hypothetical protein
VAVLTAGGLDGRDGKRDGNCLGFASDSGR